MIEELKWEPLFVMRLQAAYDRAQRIVSGQASNAWFAGPPRLLDSNVTIEFGRNAPETRPLPGRRKDEDRGRAPRRVPAARCVRPAPGRSRRPRAEC